MGVELFKDYDFLALHLCPDASSPTSLLALALAMQKKVQSVMDVGSGNISYVSQLPGEVRRAVCDCSAEALKGLSGMEVYVRSLPCLGFMTGEFELVSVLHVLEHLGDDIYEASIREVGRISSRYVLVGSPFLQDLSAAYVRCPSCRCIFQCEGHARAFDMREIWRMQRTFGGISEIYFCGEGGVSGGLYGVYRLQIGLKRLVRRSLQMAFGKMYCLPPFTKCPRCETELFWNYGTWQSSSRRCSKGQDHWNFRDARKVSDYFVALYDRHRELLEYRKLSRGCY